MYPVIHKHQIIFLDQTSFYAYFMIIEENKREVIINFQGRAMVEKSNLINCENNKNLKSKLFSTFIEFAIYIALSL